MQKILETVKFFGWPVICGLLAAFLYVQNQQLQQAADQLAAISLERTDTSPPGFAEVITRRPFSCEHQRHQRKYRIR